MGCFNLRFTPYHYHLEPKKTILIGSDQLTSLSQILKFLKKVPEYNYISATDTGNVLDMMKMVSPRLVVLSFDDNQQMIKALASNMEYAKIPILCLSNDDESFSWDKYSIVFNQNRERILQNDRLVLLINSILTLQNQSKMEMQQRGLFDQLNAVEEEGQSQVPSYQLELEQKVEVLKKVKSKAYMTRSMILLKTGCCPLPILSRCRYRTRSIGKISSYSSMKPTQASLSHLPIGIPYSPTATLNTAATCGWVCRMKISGIYLASIKKV